MVKFRYFTAENIIKKIYIYQEWQSLQLRFVLCTLYMYDFIEHIVRVQLM